MNTPSPSDDRRVRAGAAAVELTPDRPLFLYGYPHVPRTSTTVLDPLYASALYLHGVEGEVLFVACDLICVPRDVSHRARQRIAESVGISPTCVMITATHTHSGPLTQTMLSNAADPVIPPPDAEYLVQVEDAIVLAGQRAHGAARPATLSFAVADGKMLGTNRHDPSGPSLPQVPVLWCADEQGKPIAVMAVCTMHPTVLHEDSTRISGDFPGQARQHLQLHGIGRDCPFVYHMGASGNQSPRHVVKANTVEEVSRLGEALARSITDAVSRAEPMGDVNISVRHTTMELPLRTLPALETASADLHRITERYESLRASGAPRTEVRTAECDCFGAQETLTLARAAASGELAQAAAACMPAEVQVVHIGSHALVGWPGEAFVEYALSVRERFPDAWIITMANGGLQGYLVTQEAIDERFYEAGNAVFASPESGQRLVEATCKLLQEHD